jgi:hypothetical protein
MPIGSAPISDKLKGISMKAVKPIALFLTVLLVTPAFAQTAAGEVQRNVNQQQRIESGLKSGQLTTREAARLEREEAHINQVQARALKDGTLSDAEKRRIDRLQNKASRDIHAEKHDAQTGNPNFASSKRMQADVQRNINQQRRIENGVATGALTRHETARLERGAAKVERKESRAGRDGHVGLREQRQAQQAENRQSQRIAHQKHDRQHRT